MITAFAQRLTTLPTINASTTEFAINVMGVYWHKYGK